MVGVQAWHISWAVGEKRRQCQLQHCSFQPLDFFFDQVADAVLGQVDLGGVNAEGVGGLFDAPAFQHIAVEDLELAGGDLGFYTLQRGGEDVILPLLVPDFLELVFFSAAILSRMTDVLSSV